MLLDILRKRTSIRNFTDKAISQEILMDILEAGRLSPSGGNEQPWQFGVITDRAMIEKLADASYKQSWIKTSPLVIVLCSTIVADERGGRQIQKDRFTRWKDAIGSMDKELYSSLNSEEHQTKIPGTHMILQALEHGVYSTWISYFDVGKISKLLMLPKLVIPSEMIAFGYPETEPTTRQKKNLEQIVFYNQYK